MDLEFVGSIVFIVQLLKIAQSDKRLFYILCLRIWKIKILNYN